MSSLQLKPKKEINYVKRYQSKQMRKKMVLFVVVGIVVMIGGFQLGSFLGITIMRDVSLIVGVVVMVLPIVGKSMAAAKRRDSIDKNLPIFILALVSSVQSGVSLLRAVEEAAGRNMGSLTPDLLNLRANISWGMPYREAFDHFIERVGTRLARRVGVLLQISMDIGGDVVSTLELIQKHVTEMSNIEKERKQALAPYVYTIYISFVVFISVTVLLVTQFFSEITKVQQELILISQETDIPLGMFGSILGVDVDALNSILFNMSLIEAIFGGIAAGKISSGSFAAGIKHVIIMMIMAIVVFAALGAV